MKINNAKIFITGGTGSFGVAFINRLLELKPKEIRIFSRDEKKQSDLKRIYPQNYIKWYLGDVRDRDSLIDPMESVDIVFHAAALKQIPSLENFPLEATKTNIIGTDNVFSVAIQQKVKRIVFLSTDKSIQPISAMGLTKALMEKVVLAKAKLYETPIMNIVRYGNVLASRGSVVPLFIDAINDGKPITLYHPESTRFLMPIEDAIDLVLLAIKDGRHGEIFVPKVQSASLTMMVQSLEKILQKKAKINIESLRQGDKIHEQMIEDDEYAHTVSTENGYVIDGFKTKPLPTNVIKPFYSKDVMMTALDLTKLLTNIVRHYLK